MVLPWIFTAISLVTAVVAVAVVLLNRPEMTYPYDYDETPYPRQRRLTPPPRYSRTPPVTPPQHAEEDKKSTKANEERPEQKKQPEISKCDICFKEVPPSKDRWSLTCGHRFHEKCLQMELYRKLEDKKLEDRKLEDKKLEDRKLEDSKLEDRKLEDSKLEDRKLEERCPTCGEKLNHSRHDEKPKLVEHIS